MSELLQSIKADLLSRHMLPLLAVAGVALFGALTYSVLGSGGGKVRPPALASVKPSSGGLPVAIAPPSATAAAAETPAGVRYQTQGATRNPFTPLPGSSATSAAGAVATASQAKSSSSSSIASRSSSSSSPPPSSSSHGGGSGLKSPAPVPTHSTPAPAPKPEVLSFYSVSALFGLAPSKPGEQARLTPYDEMKRFEPLPAPKAPLVVFVGVLAKSGLRAVFALVVAPILRGQASCFPSDTHCQAIELAPGKSEELEYVKLDGEAVAFQLEVVKISKRGATAGAARVKALRVSKAGRRALRRAGLSALG